MSLPAINLWVHARLPKGHRRRAAIERELGHMKSDGLLGRNFLKGVAGDAQNVILSGAGYNMRKILAHHRALIRRLMASPGSLFRASSPCSKQKRPLTRPSWLPNRQNGIIQGRLQ